MDRVGRKHWRVTSALLVVLLMVAQTTAAAHAYAHDPGSLQETACATCVTAGELESACLDSGVVVDVRVFHSCLEAGQQLPVESIPTLSARQRGPPGFS